MKKAVYNNDICSHFTTQDLKKWVKRYNIINDKTHKAYSTSYLEEFLSSSTVGSTSTKTDKGLIKLGTSPESYKFR